ncbi:MAG: cyclophilin-like fold protein [Nitrososphaerota archaeon]
MSEPPSHKMRIPINIDIEEVGILEGEFIRFYAPLTIRELLKMMPIEGFAAKWGYAVYIQVNLKRGAEKPAEKINPGDILYWPPGPYLLLSFKEATPPSQSVRIGKIDKNYGLLEQVKPGSRIRFILK